ncbi:hypothetical protein Aple_055640 [Acrocarpospora pleiomorpha]|uniref:DM13 domain-containing protein n=1 Tax=Acrocarpospora pleiomorpha TaxID=90975 RepID=A0A5M3XPK2_9ACTN|nr:hypothetical protein [Acrocarpospora pleiomorpha]GES22666.1 hypothetical protein Aple_055640 [Acrocarpospora pleiomorpha]
MRTTLGLLLAASLTFPALPAEAAVSAQRSFTVHSAWVRLTSGAPLKRDDFAGTMTKDGTLYTLNGTLKDRHGEGSSAYLYISWGPKSSWIGFDPGDDRVGVPGSQRVIAKFRSPRFVKLRVCDKPKTSSSPGCGSWKFVVGS